MLPQRISINLAKNIFSKQYACPMNHFNMFTQHRQNLYEKLGDDLAFLRGGLSTCLYDTDTDLKFRQESNFYYVTGCNEPDCCCLLDGAAKKFILFVAEITPSHELWMGKLMTPQEQKIAYKADEVVLTKDMDNYLQNYSGRTVHTILDIPQIPNYDLKGMKVENDLHGILAELRVIKDILEINDLKESCAINAKAHEFVMAHLREGMKEYQMEAMHAYVYMMNGSPNKSFCSITASGKNCSTLHFVHNTNEIGKGVTCLLDAGCEVRNACSDHTRTFPSGEQFTKRQEELYEVVLASNKAGIAAMKPDVKWEDVHIAALAELLKGLRRLGIVRAELDFNEQMELGIPAFFQPHGIGHMLGLSTHDVGGVDKSRQKDPNDRKIKYLRSNRILKPGMVLTIEPGIYFIEQLLTEAKNTPEIAKHLNFDLVEQYRAECGGYRIEDDVLVTETGHEVLPGPVKELGQIYALRKQAYA